MMTRERLIEILAETIQAQTETDNVGDGESIVFFGEMPSLNLGIVADRILAEPVRVDAPRRVQCRRTKGWRMPPNTVYVGRPGKWGNPYKVAPEFKSDGIFIPAVTVESAVTLYREHMEGRLQYPAIREMLETLRGKNLACWCALDKPCHADVLLELANR